MKIKSRANVHDIWVEFEFEGSSGEMEELPKYIKSLKDSLKLLASKQN